MSDKTFEKPDEQIMLTAMVLQDIKDGLQNQKNNSTVAIQAQTPNAYYWAQFDPLDEEQWFDGFYGDIREIPSFGMGIASDKLMVLELLKTKGIVRNFNVNSSEEDHGLNHPVEMIRGFDIELNLVKFLKYYEKYTNAAEPYLKRKPNKHESLPVDDTAAATAHAKIDGTKVLVGYADRELVLQKRVRMDGGLYNLMHYLQSHTGRTIALADIQALDGCATYDDLGEQVRYLGFNKELKAIFFDGVSEKQVRFTPQVNLTKEQQDDFNQHLKTLRN